MMDDDLAVARGVLEKDTSFSFVLVKDGQTLRCGKQRGVGEIVPILAAMNVLGASLADKVVGRAVAAMAIRSRLRAVHGHVMSAGAEAWLQSAGILVSGERRVPTLMGREGQPCPMEQEDWTERGAVEAADHLCRLYPPMLDVRYGRGSLHVPRPQGVRVMVCRPVTSEPVQDVDSAVQDALAHPIASPSLKDLAQQKKEGSVCIVVSDITRPIPYRLLLPPLLYTLEDAGISRDRILLLVATGMHRRSTHEERIEMYGEEVVQCYRIEDHVATENEAHIVLPRPTRHETLVHVDRRYVNADLKIVTGLVEPHFMAGFSGGRKAICPGLVNPQTVQKFHGFAFLESDRSSTAVIEGNPCHEEASDVAHMVGVDFMVNVTINLERRVTGIFAGDLDAAFQAACDHALAECRVSLPREADVVLTSGGGYPLDQTFYQTVKGIVGAMPGVRPWPHGTILICSECSEGIGSDGYKKILLEYAGRPDDFVRDIQQTQWVFRVDQWQHQMQTKALRRVHMDGLVLCTDGIPERDQAQLSLTPLPVALRERGWNDRTNEHSLGERVGLLLEKMAQRIRENEGRDLEVVVIPEGPYVVLEIEKHA